MLALVLGIAGAAGWIIFDVAVSILTYPLMSPATWWAFVISGAVLVIVTVVAQVLEYIEFQKDSAKHSMEHEALARGSIAVWEKLESITQTSGQPAIKTIEVAVQKIARLEDKVARHDAISWGAVNDEDKQRLIATLVGFGKHSVAITAHENSDCVELAHDLKDCFRRAGWEVSRIPITGTWASAGASGFSLATTASLDMLHRPLLEALLGAARGPISGIAGGPPPIEPQPDFYILVGPKRVHYDDDL